MCSSRQTEDVNQTLKNVKPDLTLNLYSHICAQSKVWRTYMTNVEISINIVSQPKNIHFKTNCVTYSTDPSIVCSEIIHIKTYCYCGMLTSFITQSIPLTLSSAVFTCYNNINKVNKSKNYLNTC